MIVSLCYISLPGFWSLVIFLISFLTASVFLWQNLLTKSMLRGKCILRPARGASTLVCVATVRKIKSQEALQGHGWFQGSCVSTVTGTEWHSVSTKSTGSFRETRRAGRIASCIKELHDGTALGWNLLVVFGSRLMNPGEIPVKTV